MTISDKFLSTMIYRIKFSIEMLYLYPMNKTSSCLILIFIMLNQFISAQARFDRVDSIPVREGSTSLLNPWAGGINFPMVSEIDLNGDGIHDLFIFDAHNNRIIPYLNDGTPGVNAWHFSPAYIPKFPPINKWALLYDYNCDGKQDLFTLSTSPPSGIAVYRNDFTIANGLQWTLVNPFLQEKFATITTNIFASGVSLPTFSDIDGDGDMDILGYNSVPDGRIVYHRNVSMDEFGHCDSLKFEYATGCWGNFALRIGSTNSVSCFHCPCREASPDFIRQYEDSVVYDPSDAARLDDTISNVFALDLDGDGAKELLIGDISSENTLLVHNGGTPSSAEMDTQDTAFPSNDVSAIFNGFHFHSYIDLDNDSKKDLLVLAHEFVNRRGMWWYKNNGTNASPVFNKQSEGFLQDKMIDVGENAAPVFFDYNADGLLDLVIAGTSYTNSTIGDKSGLSIYRNVGTASVPSFEFVTDDFGSFSLLGYSSPWFPAFADLDADGDEDLVLGIEDGTLQYFNNSAGPGNTASFQLALPHFMGIDVGNAASPQLFDLNKDGKLDLLVGEKNGFINYFENAGTTGSAFFPSLPTNDSLGCIVRRMPMSPDGFTVPFAYDSTNKTRLLVSDFSGNIYDYRNINNNLSGCFNLTDSVFDVQESSRVKNNLTVSGADINSDGLVDLVIGLASGGVHIYLQRDPTLSVEDLRIDFPSFDLYPNPANEKLQLVLKNFNPAESVQLSISDCLGRILYSQPVGQSISDIDIRKFSAGIYFVQVRTKKNSQVKRLVISH